MNTMKWLLKREFWENKGGFFWAPVIGGSLFILLNVMFAVVGYATTSRNNIQLGMFKIDQAIAGADPAMLRQAGAALDLSILLVAALVMTVTAIVVFFYSISALYDERRDRSILFWKSLPLSDTETVLSKVIAATVLAPAIGVVAGVLTALLMFLLFGAFGLLYEQNLFGVMFGASQPLKMALLLFAALPVMALWSLPTVGWLMLCSVWARNKPFLWAVAIPVAAGIMVSWFDMLRSFAIPDSWFWKNVVGRMLLSVFPGSWLPTTDPARFEHVRGPDDLSAMVGFGELYSTLGRLDLWIGVVAGIAMLAVAVRLRRWRDDG
jgi:ABC-2 type transport system permease protein